MLDERERLEQFELRVGEAAQRRKTLQTRISRANTTLMSTLHSLIQRRVQELNKPLRVHGYALIPHMEDSSSSGSQVITIHIIVSLLNGRPVQPEVLFNYTHDDDANIAVTPTGFDLDQVIIDLDDSECAAKVICTLDDFSEAAIIEILA